MNDCNDNYNENRVTSAWKKQDLMLEKMFLYPQV